MPVAPAAIAVEGQAAPSAGAAESRATYAVIVDNEPGVLHRVVGLFSARGYNIESLTVAETDHAAHLSRITIVTRGAPPVLAQIKAQLERMVQTRQVRDLGADPQALERELGLLKTRGSGQRERARALAEASGARVVDATPGSFVFELTGASAEIDAFEAALRPLGLVEVSRTGVLSLRRGPPPD